MASDDARWGGQLQDPPLHGLALRQPPANPQAEQALLGGLLANNRWFGDVAEFLRPEHFSDPAHAAIYEAIQNKIDQGAVADAITLKAVMEHSGALDPVGGTAYLAHLITAMVSPKLVGDYGRTVHDAWRRRQMVAAGEALVNAAFDGQMDVHEGVARAMTGVDGMLEGGGTDRKPFILIDAIDAAIQDAEDAAQGGGPTGLSTGMPSVDEALGGLGAEEMIVLAARPGMGKTALGVQWAKAVARACRDGVATGGERRGVLLLSLEMAAKQIGRRVLAEEAGIPVAVLKGGRHASYANQIVAARRRLHDLPLLIEDMPGQTVKQLHAKARSAARRFGKLALIVVDHIHIVRPETADAKNGGTWAVGQISNALKRMAKEFQCPVVALAQLNRGVEARDEKRPSMSDLRYSGEIEQDADAICFLYREEYYLGTSEPTQKTGETIDAFRARKVTVTQQRAEAKGKAELILSKVRDGEPKTVFLDWHGPTTSFSDPGNDPDQREMSA